MTSTQLARDASPSVWPRSSRTGSHLLTSRKRSNMSSNAVNDGLPPYESAAEDLKQNPGQWQAYESKASCVVLAGPGAARRRRSRSNWLRMAALDIRPPRKLACITYNNECVLELKRRLKRLGIDERRNVFIGTVHSFCLQNLVLPYAHLAGEPIPHPIVVATSKEQHLIFAEAVRDVIGVGRKSRQAENTSVQTQMHCSRSVDR